MVGELHIGGAGVARGYLGRPGLTADRFIPDPFGATPGGRLYRTGDLARRRPDGALVYCGRIDHQVKINGLRIELGEIETALAAHPAVAQAVVTVVTGKSGPRSLAAYLRPRAAARSAPELTVAELRAYLSGRLPGYMIPAHLITVAEFPLNASGKIDRAALPPPRPGPPAASRARPATRTETVLAGLFGDILHCAPPGADDSFFSLGGSSLQVMRLLDLIRQHTGADLSLTSVFLHPTPRELGAAIDARTLTPAQAPADQTPPGPAPLPPGAAAAGPIVRLTSGPGQLPLYLIHPVSGTVFGYAPLASELAAAFQVYGLQSPALTRPAEAAAAPRVALAELVGDYTERIRAAQPEGPYRLAGWSMGGIIAYEIARRLERSGARVALLALLDAPFAVPATAASGPELASQFIADAALSQGWDPAGLPDPARPAASQLAWLADRLTPADAAGHLAAAEVRRRELAELLRQRFEVFQAHVQMLAGYQPDQTRAGQAKEAAEDAALFAAVTRADPAHGTPETATAGLVLAPTLIVTADRSLNAPARRLWPAVLGGPVAVLPVDADHYSFLRPPLAAEVAAAVRRQPAGS